IPTFATLPRGSSALDKSFPRRKAMKYGSKRHFVRYGLVAVLSFLAIGAQPMRAESEGGRTVKYSQKDIVQIRARIRFSTLIVLPQNEDILDFATGDKDFWIINGIHNLCYVHPAQSGIKTDLHLITSSGHVYSFLLTEVGNGQNAEPDLKVFIEPTD